jgi:DNA-binding transcriptional regulator YiaG
LWPGASSRHHAATVPPTLRELREQRSGLTQTDVARLLAVRQATVNRWEMGHARPSRRHLAALARLYRCEVEAVASALEVE